MTTFAFLKREKDYECFALVTGRENTVNERSCLHSSLGSKAGLVWNQSELGSRAVSAVLLKGCKWCKMLIALSFLLLVLMYLLFCSIMTVIWLLGVGGMGFKSFVLRICQQRLCNCVREGQYLPFLKKERKKACLPSARNNRFQDNLTKSYHLPGGLILKLHPFF